MNAFGIDHDPLSKSLVPGKGYVKAAEMTSGMRNIVRNRLTGPSHFHNPGQKVVGQSAKGRQLWDEHETRSMGRRISTDILDDVKTHRGKLISQGEKLMGHSKPNGKGGGILRINTSTSREEQAATYRHEMAHLKPKRNPVRFSERTQDPFRLGREEGRADYTANKKKTPGSYPGTKDFQRGYNDVQNRMHAKRKPSTFVVDRNGTAVKKSFNRMAPKLIRAAGRQPWGPGMQDRMRANYVVARLQQGENKAKAAYSKEFANSSMTAIQRMNRRKKKVLP